MKNKDKLRTLDLDSGPSNISNPQSPSSACRPIEAYVLRAQELSVSQLREIASQSTASKADIEKDPEDPEPEEKGTRKTDNYPLASWRLILICATILRRAFQERYRSRHEEKYTERFPHYIGKQGRSTFLFLFLFYLNLANCSLPFEGTPALRILLQYSTQANDSAREKVGFLFLFYF